MVAVKRVAYWLMTLGAVPLATFLLALGVEGRVTLQWALLLGAPAISSIAVGVLLGRSAISVAIGTVLSTAITWLYVLLLLWYLFEVVGIR